MNSAAPSDSESNVSGFIRYSDKDVKHLYATLHQNMETINQEVLQIEKNMKNLIKQAGPFESQLTALLQSFPTSSALPMETDSDE